LKQRQAIFTFHYIWTQPPLHISQNTKKPITHKLNDLSHSQTITVSNGKQSANTWATGVRPIRMLSSWACIADRPNSCSLPHSHSHSHLVVRRRHASALQHSASPRHHPVPRPYPPVCFHLACRGHGTCHHHLVATMRRSPPVQTLSPAAG
jgi:hypothetical protein